MELLRDPFTGTPGDALSVYNPNYVMVTGLTGVFVINANGTQINGDAAGGTAAYIRPDIVPPNADYLVSADITMVASVPSGPAAGVIGRGSPSANTYYSARFLSAGSNTGSWQLRRVINGTVLAVASTPNVTYTNGQVFNVKLGMSGSNLSLYLDGSSTPTLGPIADTGITAAGHPGLYGLNALSGRYRIDNLVVDDGQAASGGATTTTVAPAAAPLVVTGHAPTIARTANQAVSPAPAALTVRGYAPAITQTGQQPAQAPVTGGGGGAGSVRDVRAFADELDRAQKPTKAQKKQRRRLIEAAVLELLPDEPAAERAAPIIAQMVARQLPPATWAPVRAMQPITLPPAVFANVRAQVDEWLRMQMLLADLDDEFETELLLLG